ncbi:hypothetical protein MYAM1_000986 [Malassezia yamatoensis]|uniref:Bud22 domain-containing protein n=1 Tax=Malassezia yamatoensis TaxID=253288 RepID=A0AAJ6CHW8_9BASI|nr:hypothetical protein MYAM1_000986 [Malassezia yamatoensis]
MPKVLKAPKHTGEKINHAVNSTKLQTKLVGESFTQYHTIKIAKNAAKKARQFEIQRHIRRLKQAQNAESKAKSSSPPEELERDIDLLKQVDTHSVATSALVSKLIKYKLLPRHQFDASPDEESIETYPLWPVAEQLGIITSRNTVHKSKDTERIFHQVQSNKAFAEELAKCAQALAALVSPPRKAEVPVKDEILEPIATSKSLSKSSSKKSVEQDVLSDGYSSDDGFSDDETERLEGQPQNWRDSDELDAMVGSGSDTPDSESDSSSDSETELNAGDDRVYDESEGRRAERRKRIRDETSDSDDNFLPSLATSFIPPTAADDWDDAEADYADRDAEGKGPPKSMRKNRRGQRERRAIWEKKYGKNANHLKLRAKEPRHPKQRESTRMPRPDLPQDSANAVPLASRSTPRNSVPLSKSGESRASAISGKPNDLHPSWAAKQQAKEAQAALRPVGKKIVFD